MNFHDNYHGTAQFADYAMIERAGLYRANKGLYLGYDDRGRILRSDTMAAVLLQGGARSGKGDHIVPWLVDGHYNDHIINMDWKGQNGSISQLQALQGRHVINFAPRGMEGVVSHRINPVAYLNSTSLTLIPDSKMFAASFIPLSGSVNGEYFESLAQGMTEAVGITLARIDGQVTLPKLADLMIQFGSLSDDWLCFEEHMSAMPEASIQQAVEQAKTLRESSDDSAGGLRGAMGEIAKAFACMSDPQLRYALSPPYDWCLSELTKDNSIPTIVNVMEKQEFASTSAPVIKAFYTGALIHKSRALSARRQLWNLDEVGNIGKWPLAVTLATLAAGYGIRTVYVVQSRAQLDNLAPNAGDIIGNSCGTQIIKGIRSYSEASPVSRSLGTSTIEREDFNNNTAANEEAWNHYWAALNGKADAFEAFCTLERTRYRANHKVKVGRPLRTADELLNMNDRQAIVFMSGTLDAPALVHVPQYWTRPDLRGRYLEDPYHSMGGKVSVRGSFFQRKRRIVTAPVPEKLSSYPQYSNGLWSYVDGYRPKFKGRKY